ncbi:submaxillary gland androgen-regulated protein 3B [Pteropus medius]|uniref:vegetative cell wall protein gp1-like n=1 Tax=Pteropus vampyrus TaxID=132908 RepID=UPI00196AC947|nr:vegetative cell wall protein gp1-like [Pteropus giganteus]
MHELGEGKTIASPWVHREGHMFRAPLQPRRCGRPARPPGPCFLAPRFVSPPAVASSPRRPQPSFGRRLPRGPYEAGALALPHSLRPFPRQPLSSLPPPAPPPPGSLPTRPPASLERGSAPSSPGPAGAPSSSPPPSPSPQPQGSPVPHL